MGIQKDVLVWSAHDLSALPITIGGTFTVTGTPDLMAFKDDIDAGDPGTFPGEVRPTDFGPYDADQAISGTLEGMSFLGDTGNPSEDVFQFDIACRVTDGINTFNIYMIHNNIIHGYVSERTLEPNTTYTILDTDGTVNDSAGTFPADPLWSALAGHVDGTSGDDVIGAGFVDDDDDAVGGNDGQNNVILGEGGGDIIRAGAGDDLVYGDHVDEVPAGVSEYVVQGFVRDLNFELTAGHLQTPGTTASFNVSGPPVEIRILDNDPGAGDDDDKNETPTDTDQLIEINGVLYRFAPDYQVQFLGSDGITYTMMVVDVDRNRSGRIEDYDASSDPGDAAYENGQILLPVGAVPPAGVTLTPTSQELLTIVNPDYTALSGGAAITNYDDLIAGNSGNDTILGGRGDDTITGGTGDDSITGGRGDDLFIYAAGDGADTITDFNTGNTGVINDGDQSNNDMVDLSGFYNDSSRNDVEALGIDSFRNNLDMLRADMVDGTLDGIINGTDYSTIIGEIDLALQTDGTAVTGGNLTFDNTNVTCFTRGTLITTEDGEQPIETLCQGDMILTMDSGYQPIRWIGAANVSEDTLGDNDNLRPVRIRAGALGDDLPVDDLLVSPQHRILIRSKIAKRMFGSNEVLVAAKYLLEVAGIDIVDDMKQVEYFHFLFDKHEVVFSNGAATESMYTGPQALKSVSPMARDEILTLFPQLLDVDYKALQCREFVRGRRGRKLAERHRNSGKMLFAAPAGDC